ncbi:hypothetical protein HMPREF3180_00566 [Leptotrichia wadei]|uniref:Uncharacterized protein n=2 Tax=Leptotrichia wadei TaxID=157687 RepID=A0A134AMU0_9FUSO|nr:hypothetical protein HMPREF9015_01460 [Leptotrichia wadei F0279]KXB69024.1 hypothetical protein HMPREF3180_00566 [Leptotrichia wadei]
MGNIEVSEMVLLFLFYRKLTKYYLYFLNRFMSDIQTRRKNLLKVNCCIIFYQGR